MPMKATAGRGRIFPVASTAWPGATGCKPHPSNLRTAYRRPEARGTANIGYALVAQRVTLRRDPEDAPLGRRPSVG